MSSAVHPLLHFGFTVEVVNSNVLPGSSLVGGCGGVSGTGSFAVISVSAIVMSSSIGSQR
jgi:hypothetical protein